MSNTTEQIKTKQNNTKLVRAGHHQSNYVAGVVGRMSALFLADVGELANIDTTTKDTLNNVMSICIDALNEKFKPSVKLELKDYDFQSGKYSRDKPIQEVTPQATPQTATIPTPQEAVVPQIATADTKPTIPINPQLVAWIKANKNDTTDFDSLRQQLKACGNSDDLIDAHFTKAFPVK